MSDETLFSKIISREIPADILYQDDLVTAFRDINPQRPTHVLIVPNRIIPTADDIVSDDETGTGSDAQRGSASGKRRRHCRARVPAHHQLPGTRSARGATLAFASGRRCRLRPDDAPDGYTERRRLMAG